jgi:hypothetical protein
MLIGILKTKRHKATMGRSLCIFHFRALRMVTHAAGCYQQQHALWVQYPSDRNAGQGL